MEKSTSSKKRRNYIKRSIIKLGSSYAITFPTDFLASFEDKEEGSEDKEDKTDNELKGVNVHCYKIDESSILIKKTHAESETQVLDVHIGSIESDRFPMELLESLLSCARKLNVNQLNIYYDEKDYEACLAIVNKFGAPIHSQNKMTVDLSRTYLEYNFADQIYGMLKNFSKIIEYTLDSPKGSDPKSSIETFLTSIQSSFNEALRVLINRLNNYYLQNDGPEGQGTTSIINTLGNRVLISHLRNISNNASNLYHYKDNPEFKKYIPIIREIPKMLKEEIDLILSTDIANKIDQINKLNKSLKTLSAKFTSVVPSQDSSRTVHEEIISSILKFIIETTLFDILQTIITRYIEHSIEIK